MIIKLEDQLTVVSVRAFFERYLKRQGLNLTRQRSIILETFMCCDNHVSAEDLLSRVRSIDRGIGQATVFRTLKLIAGSGLALETSIGGRTLLYERRDPTGHHDHIKCLGCAEIFEFKSEEIERLQEEICARAGVKLVRHRMELYGYCKKCQEQGVGND